jgi:hypothetical protein
VDYGERRALVAGVDRPAEWHSIAVGQTVSHWVDTEKALSWIGPPIAYVGFSMGVILGLPAVGAHFEGMYVAENDGGWWASHTCSWRASAMQ